MLRFVYTVLFLLASNLYILAFKKLNACIYIQHQYLKYQILTKIKANKNNY